MARFCSSIEKKKANPTQTPNSNHRWDVVTQFQHNLGLLCGCRHTAEALQIVYCLFQTADSVPSQPNQDCSDTIFHSAVHTLKPQLTTYFSGNWRENKVSILLKFLVKQKESGGELSKFALLVESETKKPHKDKEFKIEINITCISM